MSFEERVRSSYPLHNQLIITLTTTSNASSRAKAATQYIHDLRSRIEISSKKLRTLRVIVNKQRSEYEVLRDSLAKRLICKVAGKAGEHEARTSSAERAYQDAFEEQARATKDLETLHANLTEANQELLEAKDQVAIHKFTVLELDALHNKLFPPSIATITSPLPYLFRTAQPYSPTTRTPYALEIRAHAQIHTLTSGPLAKIRSQIKHEKRVVDQLCEARKSLTWAHAAIFDAEDADRYTINALYEYRALGMVLVRTTLGVAQCHAVRGVAAYEAARALRAVGEGRGCNGRGNGGGGSGDGEAEMPPLKELMILKEMCLMASAPSSPSPSTSFAPVSLLASESRPKPSQRTGHGPNDAVLGLESASGTGSRAEGSGSASGSGGGRSRSRSGSGSVSGGGGSSIRRLLDDKDIGARIAECKAEMKPVIVQVRREIGSAEARIAALEDGRRALESEARDVLRRARIGVVELIASGGVDRNGGGGEGAMAGDRENGGEHEEEVLVFMGGPPVYTP